MGGSKKVRRKHSGRVPLSAQEARKLGRDEGLNLAIAIIFTAALDSGILDTEQLRALWDKVEYLSDSIKEGYVNVHDLQKTIQEEYGVIF